MRLVSALLLLFGLDALAPAQVRPEFEVASVKIVPAGSTSESYLPTLDIAPGGTLRIFNRRLDEIIMAAYNLGVKQLVGPRWLTEPTTDPTLVTHYEIVAKVPPTPRKTRFR